MPAISKMRTPMRLLAIPKPHARARKLVLAEEGAQRVGQESGSRSSPPTIMPAARSSRATWTSSGWPLLTMRAAASCEAPIFRPTTRLARFCAPPWRRRPRWVRSERFLRAGFAGRLGLWLVLPLDLRQLRLLGLAPERERISFFISELFSGLSSATGSSTGSGSGSSTGSRECVSSSSGSSAGSFLRPKLISLFQSIHA